MARLCADSVHRKQSHRIYAEILAEHEFTRKRLERAAARLLDAEQAQAVLASGGDPLKGHA